MAQPILPDFDTSALDASKNGQELCNELKRLYEHLMTAVAMGKMKWDSVDIIYNSNDLVKKIQYKKGGIEIHEHYGYSGDVLTLTTSWILGVPPVVADWQYIHGETYSYNAKGYLTKINNKEQ